MEQAINPIWSHVIVPTHLWTVSCIILSFTVPVGGWGYGLWWGCCGLCLWHKPTQLAHSFSSILLSISVFMALSEVFHSINSPKNFPVSTFSLCSSSLLSASLVLSTTYLSVKVSSALIWTLVVDWAQSNNSLPTSYFTTSKKQHTSYIM